MRGAHRPRALRVFAYALLLLMLGCAGASPMVPTARVAPATLFVPEGYDAGVDVIEEKGRFEFEADGRKTYRYSVTFRVLDARGLEEWSSMSARWNEEIRDRPELEVVTTTADGVEHRLDPSTVQERSDDDGSLLVAPVPGIEVGATVRRSVTYRDREAPETRVVGGRHTLGLRAPVRRSVVEVDVPEQVELTAAAFGFEATATERVEQGRRILTVVGRDLPAVLGSQPDVPETVPDRPIVVFSGTRTWSGLAQEVGPALRRRYASPELAELAQELEPAAPLELVAQAQRILDAVVEPAFDRGFPRGPREVLASGEASSGERALLLAGLLRLRGLDAEVGLTERRRGLELRRRVPSLVGLDRGLVYVREGDFFVDSEHPHMRPGLVASDVAGRVVWLSSSGELVRAPTVSAEQNRYQEERIIDLVRGPEVEFVEATQADGIIESRLRARFVDSPDREIRRQLSGYIRRSYRGARLEGFNLQREGDFALAIEGRGGAFVRSDGLTTTVFLPTPILFTWLPPMIRDAVLAAQDPNAKQRVAERILADREEDFIWSEPYAARIRFIVRTPASFALAEHPKSFTVPLGPALYHQQVSKADGGWIVDVDFIIDQRRLTADEARALVGGLRELWARPVASLQFDDLAMSAINAGDVHEGISKLVDDARSTPASGTYLRLASVLLDAHFGTAALRWAEAAVALRPEDPSTLLEASRIATHDALGKRFGTGYARARAIEWLREARRHRARSPMLDYRLAEVLARGPNGQDNHDPNELEEAIALARSAAREGELEESGKLLAELLFRVDRLQDFLTEAADLPRSLEVDAHRVAGTAALESTASAVALADQMELPEEVRVVVVQQASNVLVTRQRYADAADLLHALGSLDERGRARADLYRSIADGLGRSVQGPAAPIHRLQELLALDTPPVDTFESVFTTSAWSKIRPRGEIKVLSRSARRARAQARDAGLPPSWPVDLVRSRTEFDWEGSPGVGYRVESKVLGQEGGGAGVWFVVKADKYRIQAAESDPSLLGQQALDWLDRGRVKAADRWLDWAEGVLRSDGTPFHAVRSAEPLSRRERRRLAAATLDPSDPRSMEILARAASSAPSELRGDIVRALLRGHSARGEVEDQIAVAKTLLSIDPDSVEGYGAVFAGLWAQERFDEARAWASERANAGRFDPMAESQLAQLASFLGDHDDADRRLQSMIDRGFATPETYNNLAWTRLFRGLSSDREIELARQAVDMMGGGSAASMHTLASHLVERRQLGEAMDLIVRRQQQVDAMEPDDWYVVGRALEWLGLQADAREAYDLALDAEDRPDSTRVLAERRLEKMLDSVSD